MILISKPGGSHPNISIWAISKTEKKIPNKIVISFHQDSIKFVEYAPASPAIATSSNSSTIKDQQLVE